ncbi:MAG TPA: hypothetical protein VFB72_09175 [Verrucomicrobiae bacterium]|nr:hypothetical protein [Verrucomicrobiae bacterium]
MTSQIIALRIATGFLFAIVAWRIWRVVSPGDSLQDHPAFFFIPVVLCLLVIEWPRIVWPHELNMDESQMLAQAARFLVHPVPWRDVDGTTSGPLNSLLLCVPIYFGAPADWHTSRMVLWVLQCVTLIFLYLALRVFASRAESQVALLPTILFYAFAEGLDYTPYCSEALPALLISAALWILAKEWKSDRVSVWPMLILGCLAGTIPFAKMQAAPLAVFLVIVAVILVRFKSFRDGARKPDAWQAFAAILIGALLVPGLILGAVFAKGAFRDFWISYILASSAYGGQTAFYIKAARLCLLLANTDFARYLTSTMAIPVGLIFVYRGKMDRLGRQLAVPFMVLLMQIVLTLFCFFAAGKNFPHYNFLLVPPLTLLFGLAFVGASTLERGQTEAGQEPRGLPLKFAAACALLIGFQVLNVPGYVGFAKYLVKSRDEYPTFAVVKSALAAARPGESMAIWGWMPRYYVETGLYPGTRDAVGHYVISSGPYQDYFRSRFLRDMEQNRPVLFLDAVAGGMFIWNWKVMDRHECFPALTKFIDDNYSLYLTVSYTNSTRMAAWPVRLYVLKERMAELRLTPTQLTVPDLRIPSRQASAK